MHYKQLLPAISLGTALFLVADPVLSCTIVPPEPPPIWVENHGFNPTTRRQELWVGFDLTQPGAAASTGLFGANGATCECGLVLVPGVGLVRPDSFRITAAQVVVKNLTTFAKTPIAGFDFNLEDGADIANTLASGDGALSDDPTDWFGLSTASGGVTVDPTQIAIGANDVLKLEFLVEIKRRDLKFLSGNIFQIAARSPDTPGHDAFAFSGPVTVNVSVPEPSSVLGFATLGMLGVGALRKRKPKQAVELS